MAKVDPNLWHKVLGYMSDKGLKVLASKELVLTMRQKMIRFSEVYMFSKQK